MKLLLSKKIRGRCHPIETTLLINFYWFDEIDNWLHSSVLNKIIYYRSLSHICLSEASQVFAEAMIMMAWSSAPFKSKARLKRVHDQTLLWALCWPWNKQSKYITNIQVPNRRIKLRLRAMTVGCPNSYISHGILVSILLHTFHNTHETIHPVSHLLTSLAPIGMPM